MSEYTRYTCDLGGHRSSIGSSRQNDKVTIEIGVPVLIYRIQVEDRALLAWFGEEYKEYSRKTSRLIPHLW